MITGKKSRNLVLGSLRYFKHTYKLWVQPGHSGRTESLRAPQVLINTHTLLRPTLHMFEAGVILAAQKCLTQTLTTTQVQMLFLLNYSRNLVTQDLNKAKYTEGKGGAWAATRSLNGEEKLPGEEKERVVCESWSCCAAPGILSTVALQAFFTGLCQAFVLDSGHMPLSQHSRKLSLGFLKHTSFSFSFNLERKP